MLDVIAAAPALAPDVGALRPVRVALVGLGRMGVSHAAVLSMLPGVTVVGAADPEAAAGRRLRGTGFRMPVFREPGAMLAASRPDAVWVCTPPDSHLAVTRQCLDAGAAVFVEKPLAHMLEDARALDALAATAGLPVACGYTLAFWPSFVAAGALLAAGAVGTPRRATSSMFLSQVTRPQKSWMVDARRAGGGVVANLSSHLLFVLAAWFGLPATVRATWKHVYSTVEDELRATLVMADGMEVGFESSWCVPNTPTSVTTIDVEGTNGTLRVGNAAVEVDLHQPRAGLPAGRTRLVEAELPQPASFVFHGEAYALEDAHFLRWATGGPPPPITTGAALGVQRLMEALYRSAADGGRVTPVP